MPTARVFKSGNGQAVRLPKAFRLRGNDIEIIRRGDEVALRENRKGIARAFDLLSEQSADILPRRPLDHPPRRRNGL